MKESLKIIPAQHANMEAIQALLQQNGLPMSDITLENTDFFAAYLNDQLIGSIGLQVIGNVALLRSMVVEDRYRNLHIGRQLYAEVMQLAAQKQVQDVFLITTTARAYFAEKGFEPIDRQQAPESIQQTTQFSKTCPSSGIVMRKHITAGELAARK